MNVNTGSGKFRDSPQPGDMLVGRYEIKTVLGEGDRKRTYLAHDSKVNRFVAISLVMPEAVASDPEGTTREAQVLGAVGSHDNIVSLHDYGIDELSGYEYMVFEYLGGGTLAGYLKQRGPLPVEMLLKFGRQLCRGLSHLHSKGLIHRDLSLTNVWLDDRLTAHLGDFDSAVYVDEQEKRKPPTTNSFAAPEELAGGRLEVQSDLFSLGRVLFALATADFDSADTTDLRKLRPEIPTPFADLIDSLIAPSPQDRPGSAEAVLQWLDDVAQSPYIDSLIRAGESSTVEFKSSLLHPSDQLSEDLEKGVEQGALTPERAREIQMGRLAKKDLLKALSHEVTKTVAAFLNTEGGTLLIGVTDDGIVVGIEDDFQHLGSLSPDEDGWQRKFKDTLMGAFDSDIWSAVRVFFVPHEEHSVAVIRCDRRGVETWHKGSDKEGDTDEHFYIRLTSTTEELKGSDLVRYIRQHWGR